MLAAAACAPAAPAASPSPAGAIPSVRTPAAGAARATCAPAAGPAGAPAAASLVGPGSPFAPASTSATSAAIAPARRRPPRPRPPPAIVALPSARPLPPGNRWAALRGPIIHSSRGSWATGTRRGIGLLSVQTVETVNESARHRQRPRDIFSASRAPNWRNRLTPRRWPVAAWKPPSNGGGRGLRLLPRDAGDAIKVAIEAVNAGSSRALNMGNDQRVGEIEVCGAIEAERSNIQAFARQLHAFQTDESGQICRDVLSRQVVQRPGRQHLHRFNKDRFTSRGSRGAQFELVHQERGALALLGLIAGDVADEHVRVDVRRRQGRSSPSVAARPACSSAAISVISAQVRAGVSAGTDW